MVAIMAICGDTWRAVRQMCMLLMEEARAPQEGHRASPRSRSDTQSIRHAVDPITKRASDKMPLPRARIRYALRNGTRHGDKASPPYLTSGGYTTEATRAPGRK